MAPDELKIVDKGSYILVEFFGEFSVEAGKRCVDRMVQACVEYDRTAVLLDCRKMTGNLRIMDRFEVMVYGQATRGKIARVALVNRPEDTLPDGFSENVGVNRGVNLRIFTHIDKASEWLRS